MEIKEKKISVGITTLINVGNFENFTVKCEREAFFNGDATLEEERLLHKELFKECMEEILLEANYAVKVLGKEPIVPLPKPKKRESNDAQ